MFLKTESGHGRSVAKAISWRVLGSLDTLGVAFLVTGHLGAASAVASFEVLTKTVLYYVHERAWVALPSKIAAVFSKSAASAA